jgi:tRNA1(Val) A37 N6-methylase TrmN6
MLTLANVSTNDVLYDLGSGDGRIPITAAQKYNVRSAIGVEINPQLVQQSQENAKKARV